MVAALEKRLVTELGAIARITFLAADTGYAVLQIEKDDFSTFTAAGTMPDAAKGMQVELTGEWKNHPKFGRQFNFVSCSIPEPTTEAGAIAFLSTLKGVGESMAKRIWAAFGEDVFRLLEEDGDRLLEVSGVGKKTLPLLLASYQTSKGIRKLITFLAEIGVSAGYAPRIYKEYGEDAIRQIKENPYILAEDVRGFGFKKADEVALAMQVAPDSKLRVEAGIMHTLKGAASLNGHCYLLDDELAVQVCGILALPDFRPQMSDIEAVIRSLRKSSTQKSKRLVADGNKIYLHSYYQAECDLAEKIKQLAGVLQSDIDLEAWISEYEAENEIQLAKGQREAIAVAASNGLAVMTGGAGVGKMQPYDEPVLTPDGWLPMRDIKVGSLVISKDGTPAKVLEVFPGSNLEIYKVSFDDGTWTECCIDHLWAVQSPKQRDRRKGNYSVLQLRDMLEKINNPKLDSRKTSANTDRIKHYYYSVDYCDPVLFPKRDVPLHPYLLGWLLGDGYLPRKKGACISVWGKDAEEVAQRLDSCLPEDVKSNLHAPSPSNLNVRKYNLSVSLNQYLKSIGLLGCKSRDKFIPEQYMFSDVTDRKFLLSGLLDTDGSGSQGKTRFSSHSKRMAEQVVELARSLGGRATLSAADRGDNVEYHVYLKTPFNPFLLSRKQIDCDARKMIHKFRKRIVSAEYVGRKDGQCILIDHPSHLYLTRDYTVTHNTTVSKAVINLWHAQGKRIMAACPTGKGAQRIRETTGLKSASTIHRLLGWNGYGFNHNADNPLEGDAFLIDEASMMDLRLANSLLQAIPNHAVVLIVGDVNQLPSVAAGNVLRDIIESGQVPVVRLTEIFRQAATSKIIQASLSINDGKMPHLELIGRATDRPFSDALWVKCSQDRISEAIAWLLSEKLPELGWQKDQIQVLSPMHKGDCGNLALNALIQNLWNPASRSKPSLNDFREGDRVIQQRNDYDRKVFNGDIGKIEAIDLADKEVKIRFPDLDNPSGRLISYEQGDLDDLMLAYSISIHRSQGSEFPVVIIPASMQHYMMLARNLYYTGVTRGKKLVVLVGEERAIQTAVKTQKLGQRNTALAERLSA